MIVLFLDRIVSTVFHITDINKFERYRYNKAVHYPFSAIEAYFLSINKEPWQKPIENRITVFNIKADSFVYGNFLKDSVLLSFIFYELKYLGHI
jgi:hypothetical protein